MTLRRGCPERQRASGRMHGVRVRSRRGFALLLACLLTQACSSTPSASTDAGRDGLLIDSNPQPDQPVDHGLEHDRATPDSGAWVVTGGTPGVSGTVSARAMDIHHPTGEAVVAGYLTGPVTIGARKTGTTAGWDVIAARIDSTGDVLWARIFGSNSQDVAFAAIAATSGESVVAGGFRGSLACDALGLTSAGLSDVYVARLTGKGTCSWLGRVGGPGVDMAFSAAEDPKGNLYVTGFYQGEVSFGSTSITHRGAKDCFVAKFGPAGKELWIRSFGGPAEDYCYGVTSDTSAVYVTGHFSAQATFGTTQLTATGNKPGKQGPSDLFVLRLTTGGDLSWVRAGGGATWDTGTSIDIGSKGTIVVAGICVGPATFGSKTVSTAARSVCAFGLSNSGSFLWAKALVPTVTIEYLENRPRLYMSSDGTGLVMGRFHGSASLGSTKVTSTGSKEDVVIVRIKEDGTILDASAIQGMDDLTVGGLAQSGKHVLAAGSFVGVASFGAIAKKAQGHKDLFLWRFPLD